MMHSNELKKQLQKAQKDAAKDPVCEVEGLSYDDMTTLFSKTIEDILLANAKRNHSHVVLSWAFLNRQVENVIKADVFLTDPKHPDRRHAIKLLTEFCTTHNLTCEIDDDHVTIGWA